MTTKFVAAVKNVLMAEDRTSQIAADDILVQLSCGSVVISTKILAPRPSVPSLISRLQEQGSSARIFSKLFNAIPEIKDLASRDVVLSGEIQHVSVKEPSVNESSLARDGSTAHDSRGAPGLIADPSDMQLPFVSILGVSLVLVSLMVIAIWLVVTRCRICLKLPKSGVAEILDAVGNKHLVRFKRSKLAAPKDAKEVAGIVGVAENINRNDVSNGNNLTMQDANKFHGKTHIKWDVEIERFRDLRYHLSPGLSAKSLAAGNAEAPVEDEEEDTSTLDENIVDFHQTYVLEQMEKHVMVLRDKEELDFMEVNAEFPDSAPLAVIPSSDEQPTQADAPESASALILEMPPEDSAEPAQARAEVYEKGTLVHYFSTTNGKLALATITGKGHFDSASTQFPNYDILIQGRWPALRKAVELSSLRVALQAGHPVCVFFREQRCWIPAELEGVSFPMAGVVTYTVSAFGETYSGIPQHNLKRRFPKASLVQFYHDAEVGWVSAEVYEEFEEDHYQQLPSFRESPDPRQSSNTPRLTLGMSPGQRVKIIIRPPGDVACLLKSQSTQQTGSNDTMECEATECALSNAVVGNNGVAGAASSVQREDTLHHGLLEVPSYLVRFVYQISL